MTPELIKILRQALQDIAKMADEIDPREEVPVCDEPREVRMTTGEYMELAEKNIKYFSRFPDDLKFALDKAITPATATTEALMVACVTIAKQDERIDNLQDGLDMAFRKLSAIDSQLSGQRDRMTTMDEKIDDTDGGVAHVQEQLNLIKGKQDGQRIRVNNLDGAITSINASVDRLRIQDRALEKRQDSQRSRIDNLERTLSRLQQEKSASESALSIHRERIGALETDAAASEESISAALKGQDERATRLYQRVNGLERAVGTAKPEGTVK